MAGIFDNLNQKLNNMPFAQSMGLLSAGTSMLAGDKISDSINQGLGVYQNFNQMSEEQKRKGMIDKLISEGGFTAQEQALIRASQNPAAVAVQIRNLNETRAATEANRRTFTPLSEFDVEQRGLNPDDVYQTDNFGNVSVVSSKQKPETKIIGNVLYEKNDQGNFVKSLDTNQEIFNQKFKQGKSSGMTEAEAKVYALNGTVPARFSGATSPFSGKSLAAQDSNNLIEIGLRIKNKDKTLTPMELEAYRVSYSRLGRTRRESIPDGAGGTKTVEFQPMDLTGYPVPTGMAGASQTSLTGQDETGTASQNSTNQNTLAPFGGGTIIATNPNAQVVKDEKNIKKLNSMLGNLNEYRNALKKYSMLDQFLGSIGLPNEIATDVASKSEALRLDLKNLYELGALVGGDFQILDRLLTSPNSFQGMGVEVFGDLSIQIDNLETQLRLDMSSKGYDLLGTQSRPIIAKSKKDFDAAPLFTYILMVDEETGGTQLMYKK